MDDIIFYQPLSASKSQPLRLPGAPTASNAPGGPIASLSNCHPALQLNQRNEMWTEHMIKCRDASNLSQQNHFSDQHYRNDSIQEQERLTVTRNVLNDDAKNDLVYLAELQSGIQQKDISASGNHKSDDDDGFIDIDELLAGMKKSISTSVEANSGGIAETDDNGARGGSPTSSSRLTTGSTQDSIILSDDEPLATSSETDYSEVDLGLTAKSDSDALHVADSGSFGSGTTFISSCLVSDHQDKDGDNDGIRDNTELQLAADHLRLRSASPGQTFATPQVSKLQVNTDITQETMSSVNLDVAKEIEDQGFDIVANRSDKQDRSDAGARSLRRRKNNSTFGSGIPAHDSSCDHAQPLQLNLTATHQQSGPIAESLPAAHRARKSGPRHARHNHSRSSSSIGLTTAASTASVVLKSTNLGVRQSCASATDPSQEPQLRDIDDGSTDDLTDQDYANYSDASSNAVERPPLSKQLRRAEDPSSITYHHAERDSGCLVGLSNQDVATTPSTDTLQSEEIPIRGFLTLKTFESKVIYCFSFSQELSPQPASTNVSRSSDRGDSEQSHMEEYATSRPGRRSKFLPEEDELLLQLKEVDRLSWDEIAEQFPERSKGTLQVRYSTKLKRRPGTSQKTRKRRRSE